MLDGIIISDQKGKVIFFVIDQFYNVCYASDYVSEILRYTPEQILGKDMASLVEPASLPHYYEVIDRLKNDPSEPASFKDLGVYCTICE